MKLKILCLIFFKILLRRGEINIICFFTHGKKVIKPSISVLIFLLLCSSFSVFPESNPLPDRLRFNHVIPLATEFVGEVLSIHQDKYGLIWVGGKDGLARYDGYDYKIYRHDVDDNTTLSSNVVSDIEEDAEGNLWLATDGGLNYFIRKTQVFIHYNHDPENPASLHTDRTISLYNEHNQTLWIGGDGGLNALDLKNKKMKRYPQETSSELERLLAGQYVMGIDISKDGVMYLATGFGLKVWNRDTKKVRVYGQPLAEGMHSSIVRSVLVDSQNRVWVGTELGLSRLNDDLKTFTFYLNPSDVGPALDSSVWDLLEDSYGEIWGATDGGGLIRYDAESDSFLSYMNNTRDKDSVTSTVVRTLLEDSVGDLWLGAYPGGVDIVSRHNATFDSYRNISDDETSLSFSSVNSILEDEKGNLWIGTDGGGLNYYDYATKTYSFLRFNAEAKYSIGSDAVIDMTFDRDNNLWVAHWNGGVSKINLATSEITNYIDKVNDPNFLQRPHIFSIYMDSSGTIWAGTLGGGISRYNKETDQFQQYHHDPEAGLFNVERIWNILEDSSKSLWLGTHDGLMKVDRDNNTAVRYKYDKGDESTLGSDWVISIYEDSKGRLWAGTQEGGLNLFDYETETFKRIQKEDGLSSNLINAILEDNNGLIWVSTNKGLASYNPETEKILNYSELNGLQASQFNYNAALKCKNGDLVFAGVNGLTRFNPDELTPNLDPPPVIITGLNVQEKEAKIGKDGVISENVLTADKITLNYTQNVFSITYSALNYRIPEENQYAYMLEGFDDEWQFSGTKRTKSYTNLDAGTYTFRVKASNNEGVWNHEGASIGIEIIPAPWKTWWAYTIYLLSIVAVIVWYVRGQRKVIEFQEAMMDRLKNADRLKDEFVASTSHELRTPLFGIVGLAESLLDEMAGRIKSNELTTIKMIIASGKRLVIQVNDILDYAKIRDNALEVNIRPINLYELVDMVIPLTSPIIGEKPLKLENNVKRKVPSVLADAHRLQQILINLISNAIRHTQKGRIFVTAKVKDGFMHISVTDTGKGIPEEKFDELFEKFTQLENVNSREQNGTGLGLSITKRLVELQKGRIWVESKINKGSTFTFTLPITEEHGEHVELSEDSHTRVGVLTNRNRPVQQGQDMPDGYDLTGNKNAEGDSTDIYEGMSAHILIVDDETVNRMVLGAYLKDKPLKISEADCGERAIELISMDDTIDLVLLDLMMPGMSGFETCKRIRTLYNLQELPVIFTTAKGHIEDMEKAFWVGGNDFINKPVDRKELGARVMLHLNQLKTFRAIIKKQREQGM